MLWGKNYSSIEFEDIERIVESKVSENRTLDYKKEINLVKDKNRKELLFDIASFTNSEGGVIIYGIEEEKDNNQNNTGIPAKISGIETANIDKLILAIDDLVKTSIEPNIPNIIISPLEKDYKKVLFIGIPKSHGIPRMVTYKSSNKFYKRRNSGKYLVDVYELNQMFMENIEVVEKIESFRKNRLNIMRDKSFNLNIDSKNITLLHITPMSYFQYNRLDLTGDKSIQYLTKKLRPIGGAQGWNKRLNFEGLLVFELAGENDKIGAYNQVFRNGIIEFFTHRFHGQDNDFFLGMLETHIINRVKQTIQVYEYFEIPPPFVVQLSITNLLNRYINIMDVHNIQYIPFLADDLLIPNIVINDFSEDISKQLKSLFDIIWQSAGIKESPFYNKNGIRQ